MVILFNFLLLSRVFLLVKRQILCIYLDFFIEVNCIFQFGSVVTKSLKMDYQDFWKLFYPETHLGDA